MYFSIIVYETLLVKFGEHSHVRGYDGLITHLHQVGECRMEGSRRLLQVVVWDFGEHVVHLVGA